MLDPLYENQEMIMFVREHSHMQKYWMYILLLLNKNKKEDHKI
jgi:hypothetical protein